MTERQPELFFDIIGFIAHGGQADVYLARLRSTGRIYACKMLREAWDPLARDGFRREALRQERVGGGYIVPIVARNLDAERPFLVLEYMPNGSLADELQRQGSVSPIRALSITREIAIALADLHRQGVVHRDLKPGNILRAPDGRLLLNDLGIAATITATEFVRAQGFIGTPAYAAPEQMRGLASPKSDVFALGVILRELLTGLPRPLLTLVCHVQGFAGPHVNTLHNRLCSNDPRERPTALEAIEMIDNLLRLMKTHPVTLQIAGPQPATRPTDSGWGWFAGAAALFVGALALSNNGTWDPTVGRYRGDDGRFK